MSSTSRQAQNFGPGFLPRLNFPSEFLSLNKIKTCQWAVSVCSLLLGLESWFQPVMKSGERIWMFLLRSNISLRLASSMYFGFSPRGFSEESQVSEVKKKIEFYRIAVDWTLYSYLCCYKHKNLKFFQMYLFFLSWKKKVVLYTYTLSKMFLIPFVSSNNSEALEKINHT